MSKFCRFQGFFKILYRNYRITDVFFPPIFFSFIFNREDKLKSDHCVRIEKYLFNMTMSGYGMEMKK